MYRAIGRFSAAVVVFLAALAVSWPGSHGDLFFDSIPNIANNKAIQIADLKPETLLRAALSFGEGPLGRPIPMLSFALDWYVAGPNPARFKQVNLLIHATNALLVYSLLLRMLRLQRALTSSTNPAGRAGTAAFLAGLLWAISPIHGFTVVYVVQRMVLLGALFSLIALHAYLSLRVAAALGETRRVIGYAAGLGVAAVLALACKETAVLIPFYIAVIEFFLFRFLGLGAFRRWFMAAVGLAVMVPVLALALSVWNNPEGIYAGYTLRNFGPVERMLTQTRVLMMYLRNIIVPDYGELHFFYDNFPISHSLTQPITTLFSLCFLGIVAALGYVLRARVPLLGFAFFWFFAGHWLEASFWPLELIFWHRNYLPAVGPLLALACALTALIDHPGVARTAGVALTAATLALSGIQSWLIATDWGGRIAMARAELIKNPASARANHYYGRAALFSYDADPDPKLLLEAQQSFHHALEQDPRAVLPAFALVFTAIKYGAGPVADPLAEMVRRTGTQALEIGDLSIFDGIVELHKDHPQALDLFDVLEVLEAASTNPRLIGSQKAFVLTKKAELLAAEGFPAAVYMPVLRHAVCLMPGADDYRFLLLRTLIDHGEVDEAAGMLAQGFSRPQRIREPRIEEYAKRLENLIEARRKASLLPTSAAGASTR